MKYFRTIYPTFVLFCCLLHACDIFHTRTPEPPSNPTSTFNPPTSADIVLNNLKFAVAEANTDNYIRCFSGGASSPPFLFIPSADAASLYASVFQDWTIEDERIYFHNLGVPSQGTPFLTYENQQLVFSNSDSVIYTMDYKLFFPHQSAGEPQLVSGSMQVHLAADKQSRWSVYRWQDFKIPQDTLQTWSYLKAKFRLRS